MYDVAIIGAGVIGAMTAHNLAKYNLKICILEKENDVSMGATKANSAIVHAGFDAIAGSMKARFNVKGSEMMEEICRNLSVSYKNNGSLVIGFNDDDRKQLELLLENGIKNGVKNLSLIEKDELRKMEPNISDNAVCALYAPTGAIVCPYELCTAAIGNAMDNGCDLKLNFNVADINKENDKYIILSEDGDSITSKAVINAAGLYADKIAAMISDNSFTIHPRKGEYMLLDKECGNIVSHTIFTAPTKMGKGILVSPTVDNNLILGPTAVDMEDKENKSTTRDGLSSVQQSSLNMVKGIDYRMAITSFTGLRAVGDTGDFIINTPGKCFINVAAIESPGLSASPAIAEYVAELLQENGIELSKKDNYIKTRKSYKHFSELPTDERNKIIENDPSFGNIICRCEGISEGEIVYAINQNPKPCDLDGIKRRTRAQMGRCQGGFCSPYIMNILSRELNIPLEQLTKSGGKSYVVFSKTK